MARTNTLGNYLTDIATAIKQKKGDTSTINASNFDTEILNLPSGGSDWSDYFEQSIALTTNLGNANGYMLTAVVKKFPKVTGTSTMITNAFRNCYLLEEVDLSGITLSNVTNMSGIFQNCQRLTKVDFGNLDTTNATNMSNMFYNCPLLEEVDLSNFNTSLVTTISGMFYNNTSDTSMLKTITGMNRLTNTSLTNCSNTFRNCLSLEEVDLSGFGEISTLNMSNMFYNCRALKKINLSNFNITTSVTSTGMFSNCTSLEELDMRNYIFSNDTMTNSSFSGVPNNCLIIVKDDTEKDWFTTNVSRLTNVKTVAEVGAE